MRRGALLALAVATPLAAQLRVHATGTAALTDLRPGPRVDAVTEFRIEQVMARAAWAAPNGHWRLFASLVGEGVTMADGVLNVGGFGEGFADRRHPHTYVHELGGSLVLPVGSVRMSLTVGKGFVAFGTDDPMHRPPLKYPINHHWSQLLERWVVVGAVAAGPLTLEGTLFNGDEPTRPEDWPRLGRFGDSWAVRVTGTPSPGVELQGSYASVTSPEHRPGAGPDATKWSASIALSRGRLTGLAEWAQTTEAGQAYQTVLLEGQVTLGPHRPYLRLERTDRPEEERLVDPFRTVRPHLDDHVLGVTRWTIATAGYGVRLPAAGLVLEPLIEVSVAHVRETTGALFDPWTFYGGDLLRSVTVGLRVHWGTASTMGRYGVREPLPSQEHHH